MIVDDNKDICDLIAITLRHSGYYCEEASSGYDFLEKIDSSYDLVIMDVMMAGMDALEAVQKLRKRHLTSIKIILLTAIYLDFAQKRLVRELGILETVSKPVRKDELLAIVRKYLPQQQ